MNWGEKRRFVIVATAIALGVTLLVVLAIAIFYNEPTCFDGRQNGDEVGIDCGGACAYLCIEQVQAPLVSYATVLAPGNGRTDVIAVVENRNPNAAAANIRAEVEVFDTAGMRLGLKEVSIDLPAGANVPLFVPGVTTAPGAARAFLTIDDSSVRWFRSVATEKYLAISDVAIRNPEGPSPSVSALLTNITPYPTKNLQLVATLFNAEGEAVAASASVIPALTARGSSPLIFTWPQGFASTPIRAEIVPIESL